MLQHIPHLYVLLFICHVIFVDAQTLSPHLDHDIVFRQSNGYQDYSHTARIGINLQFEKAHEDVSMQQKLMNMLPALQSVVDIPNQLLIPDYVESATELENDYDRAATMFNFDHAASSAKAAKTLETISEGVARVLRNNRRRRSPDPQPAPALPLSPLLLALFSHRRRHYNSTSFVGSYALHKQQMVQDLQDTHNAALACLSGTANATLLPSSVPVPHQRQKRQLLSHTLLPYPNVTNKDKAYYWSTITDRTKVFLLPDNANVYSPYLQYTANYVTNLQSVIDKDNKTAINTMIKETSTHTAVNGQRRMAKFLDMAVAAYLGKPDVSLLNANVVNAGLEYYNKQLKDLFGYTLATVDTYELTKFPFKLQALDGSYYLVFTVPVLKSPKSQHILVPTKTTFQLSTLSSAISLAPQLNDEVLINGSPARTTTMSHLLTNCYSVEEKFYCRDSSTHHEPPSCLAALHSGVTNRILDTCQFIVSSLTPFLTRLSGTTFIYSALTSHSFSRNCPDDNSLLSIPSGTTLVDLQNCSSLNGPELSMHRLIDAVSTPLNQSVDVDTILSHVTEGRSVDSIYTALQQSSPHFGSLNQFRTLSTSDLLLPDINDVDTLLTSFLITIFVYTMSHLVSCFTKDKSTTAEPLIAPPRTRRT